MVTFLFLLILGGIGFFIYKKYFAGLNSTAVRYFAGFLSDTKYDDYIKSYVDGMNLRKIALSKFDLDESELNELPPVCLSDYYFDEKDPLITVKKGKDRKDRSSAYQVSWLFFSSEQVCIYQYTLNFNTNGEKKATQQYYWKDIVNFNTLDETKTIYVPQKGGLPQVKTVNIKLFSLIVPGDRFNCSMPNDDSFDKTILGMKSKLREKKTR